MTGMILGIGSNSGDRESMIAAAVKRIDETFGNVVSSSVYETPALNGRDAPYLNAVVYAMTDMDMDSVNDVLKKYERECGRTPDSKIKGEVPVDMDIVVWDGEVVRKKDFDCNYFRKGYDELLADCMIPTGRMP